MLTFPRQTLGIGLLCRLSAHIAAPRGVGSRRLPGHRAPAARSPRGRVPAQPGPGGLSPHTCPSGTGQAQRPACPGGSAARSRAAVTAGGGRGWDGDAVHGQGAEQRRAGCQRSRTEDATAGSTSRSAPGLLPRREPPESRAGAGPGAFPTPQHGPTMGKGSAAICAHGPIAGARLGKAGQWGGGSLAPLPPARDTPVPALPTPSSPVGSQHPQARSSSWPKSPQRDVGVAFPGTRARGGQSRCPGVLQRCRFRAMVLGRGRQSCGGDRPVSPDTSPVPRFSALHHAALNGNTELISLLLEAQAAVDIKDNKGESPGPGRAPCPVPPAGCACCDGAWNAHGSLPCRHAAPALRSLAGQEGAHEDGAEGRLLCEHPIG